MAPAAPLAPVPRPLQDQVIDPALLMPPPPTIPPRRSGSPQTGLRSFRPQRQSSVLSPMAVEIPRPQNFVGQGLGPLIMSPIPVDPARDLAAAQLARYGSAFTVYPQMSKVECQNPQVGRPQGVESPVLQGLLNLGQQPRRYPELRALLESRRSSPPPAVPEVGAEVTLDVVNVVDSVTNPFQTRQRGQRSASLDQAIQEVNSVPEPCSGYRSDGGSFKGDGLLKRARKRSQAQKIARDEISDDSSPDPKRVRTEEESEVSTDENNNISVASNSYDHDPDCDPGLSV